jgi:hypothetical protein
MKGRVTILIFEFILTFSLQFDKNKGVGDADDHRWTLINVG